MNLHVASDSGLNLSKQSFELSTKTGHHQIRTNPSNKKKVSSPSYPTLPNTSTNRLPSTHPKTQAPVASACIQVNRSPNMPHVSYRYACSYINAIGACVEMYRGYESNNMIPWQMNVSKQSVGKSSTSRR